MIIVVYFLLLLAASVEDYKNHTVKHRWVLLVYVLGLIKLVLQKENRWVALTLTCACFVILYLFYTLVKKVAERTGKPIRFGGTDVRLIPGMMLVQGWDTALTGIFTGLFFALCCHLPKRRRKRELPLVPWMSAGCFFIEIIYLFSEKSVL